MHAAPQVGQLIWCVAHLLWTGNSFVATTSAGLMLHHLFGCWHGDRRLKAKYGEVGPRALALALALTLALRHRCLARAGALTARPEAPLSLLRPGPRAARAVCCCAPRDPGSASRRPWAHMATRSRAGV